MEESFFLWMRCACSTAHHWSCFLCVSDRRGAFRFSIIRSCNLSCLHTKALLSELFSVSCKYSPIYFIGHNRQIIANKDFSFLSFLSKKQGWTSLFSYFIMVWDSFHTLYPISSCPNHIFHFQYFDVLSSWSLANPEETTHPRVSQFSQGQWTTCEPLYIQTRQSKPHTVNHLPLLGPQFRPLSTCSNHPRAR